LKITREQLIDIAILVGTDYNDGIKGIGPKTALKYVKKYGTLEKIQSEKGVVLDMPYDQIREIFLNPPQIKFDEPKWSEPNKAELLKILSTEHDFSSDRVERSLQRLDEAIVKMQDEAKQSSLDDFF
jgi:flap endonuclease-1